MLLSPLRLALVCLFLVGLCMVLFFSIEVQSNDTRHWSKDTERMDNGKLTTCRLAKKVRKKAFSGGKWLTEYFCIYRGANKTTETMSIGVYEGDCPSTYICKYDPNPKITIDGIMNSIKKALE